MPNTSIVNLTYLTAAILSEGEIRIVPVRSLLTFGHLSWPCVHLASVKKPAMEWNSRTIKLLTAP